MVQLIEERERGCAQELKRELLSFDKLIRPRETAVSRWRDRNTRIEMVIIRFELLVLISAPIILFIMWYLKRILGT